MCLTTLGCLVAFVSGHAAGGELESVRYGPTEDRFPSHSDSYTVANINITYEDEHGEMYTETSEVSVQNLLLIPSNISRFDHNQNNRNQVCVP